LKVVAADEFFPHIDKLDNSFPLHSAVMVFSTGAISLQGTQESAPKSIIIGKSYSFNASRSIDVASRQNAPHYQAFQAF
jgi:hypothetical protein